MYAGDESHETHRDSKRLQKKAPFNIDSSKAPTSKLKKGIELLSMQVNKRLAQLPLGKINLTLNEQRTVKQESVFLHKYLQPRKEIFKKSLRILTNPFGNFDRRYWNLGKLPK